MHRSVSLYDISWSRLWLRLVGIALLSSVSVANARVTTLTINNTQPAFGGASFGSVGTYEVMTGTFTDEVDRDDPHNAVIVDIEHGPKNANGTVSFTADFQIIRPTNLANSAHRVLYDLPNRGSPGALGLLNGSSPINTAIPPGSGAAGNGFLMKMGWTVVEVGWDQSAPRGGQGFGITLPVAKNRDGASITGPAIEELVVDQGTTPATLPLTYAAATADKSKASLTVRENYGDAPQLVSSSCWDYMDSSNLNAVKLTTGNFGAAAPPCGFGPTALYEFSYIAKDPLIVGLGFAAIRDLAIFLRHAMTDDHGTANPLAGDVKYIYTICASQPCRMARDFVYWGFNEGDVPAGASPHNWGDHRRSDHFWRRGPQHHGKVIDGMLNYIGGGDGIYMNYRFAQTTRRHWQHVDRWFPAFQFPFADLTIFDPVTRRIDGRLARCEETGTCPHIFEANSANEFWAKGGSMLLTDGQGHDLDLSRTPSVRYYLLSSFQHGFGDSTTTGICRQLGNPLRVGSVQRALLVDLDQWVSEGVPPPSNRVPRIADGTLVPPLPQSRQGFPNIPNPQKTLPVTPFVAYNGILSTGDLWDFGPKFDKGIISTIPPVLLGTPYKIYVPKTDADGNDIAGVRVPSVAVPIATFTGWGLRAGDAADPVPIVDGCDATGQYIPFPNTKAQRIATGDPRPSLQERYGNSAGTNADYVAKVKAAAQALVADRFLLEVPGLVQDVETYTTPAALVTIPANP
jgi:alpha/beta hydrolase family protein